MAGNPAKRFQPSAIEGGKKKKAKKQTGLEITEVSESSASNQQPWENMRPCEIGIWRRRIMICAVAVMFALLYLRLEEESDESSDDEEEEEDEDADDNEDTAAADDDDDDEDADESSSDDDDDCVSIGSSVVGDPISQARQILDRCISLLERPT